MIDSEEIRTNSPPPTALTSNDNTININQMICRLCGNTNEKLIGIYSEEGASNELSYKINEYLPIKVQENDDLPLQCCLNCTSTLLTWHELFITTVTTANRFQDYLNNKQIIVDVAFVETKDIDTESTTQRLTTTFDENSIDDDLLSLNQNPSITYKCEYCETIFDNKTTLNNHIVHHKSIRKIKCKPIIIKTNEQLNIHLESNNIDFDDDDDDDKLESNEEFDKFANLTTKICMKCNIIFRTKTLLKRHVYDKHNIKLKRSRRKKSEIVPKFFCDLCDKGFTRKSDMEKHKKLKHYDDENVQNLLTTNKVIATTKSMNYEILKRCKITDSEDGKIYYKCDLCPRIFKQSYNMIRHRTIHTGIRSYCCHLCGKSFRMSNGLSRHINEHHLGIKKYKCDICMKRFCSRATFDEHTNIHTGERPYVCDICGKTFRQKGSLHIHKTFHTNNYRFKCDICEKKFRRNQELKHHSWIHSGHKPYKCNKCNTGFRWRNDLKRHQKVHEKSTIIDNIICRICGSNFNQERYLKAHMKIHPNIEEFKQLEIDTPKII